MTAIWGLWVLQSLWCLYNVRRFRRQVLRHEQFLRKTNHPRPPAVVIVPVKGDDGHLREHVEALFQQDYPTYRLVFVVESADDPAHGPLTDLIEARREGRGPEASLHVAGRAESGGQKVHNQLHALERLRDTDQLIVFADADAVPGPDWLIAMAFGATRKNRGAATGYRWMVPDAPNVASSIASVLNASAATLLGRARWNQAWGGSMGLLRQNMEKIDLVNRMRGALSDDYQFTRAVKAAGMKIQFVSSAMPISPVRFTFGSLVSFALRQYRISRLYAPIVWWLSLLCLSFYAVGWVTAVVAGAAGIVWAALPASAVIVLDAWRGRSRAAAFATCFGRERADLWRPAAAWDTAATPLWMGLNLLLLVASGFGRCIHWAGIRYRILGHQDVRIEGRDGAGADR
ncbi:MAG: glycosyltransferase [Phycisphaeraceae bacterium]|nr:glycosyltransferase [Phycisphaeraceae bacterium]